MGNRLRLPRYRYRYVLVILSLIIYYFSNHPKPLLRKLFKTPIFERWGKQFCLN